VLYFSAYVVASLVTFVRQYRSAAPAQKQKLRVVIAGALVGFLPFLALFVYRSILPGQLSSLESASAVCLAFVPATFAYAILKHGAIELNVVMRKGLVYAVLSAAVIAAYYAVVHFLGDVMVEEFGVSSAVLMPAAALLVALVLAPARSQVQRFVDRLFYREEYVYKQEVLEFNRQLARKLNKEEIYTHFCDRVHSLLRSSYIAFYTAGGNTNMKLEKVTGTPPTLPGTFPLDSFLGRYFSRFKTPLMAEYLDESWERPRLDPASREFLAVEALGVCVPVVAPDHFLGLVLLGEKLSGATYRRADAELLQTFAEQLALVLQNADLVQSSLEQERLKSEVMLAREIQLSLLPSEAPHLGAIELSGRMVSSMEVGGDYFDYFAVDDEHVGVAVGDVSGKGIPAAMLMSSIQAVFKNLAQKSRLGPAVVNRELNDHIAETANPDQFATFFYGVLDVSTSTLTFSNAGHCPALLVKPEYVDRLAKGGMVLGVEQDQRFLEGTVRVEPGDLMLLYTDGVTEQKDDSGEDYGEERLIDFLISNRNLPLEDLQDALLEELRAFGRGRQDDDTTIVIARHRTG
jgi:sigma-B regulation protein RsbU (phosphoserine phosphatase)